MSAALMLLLATVSVTLVDARDVAPVVLWGLKSSGSSTPGGVDPFYVMPAGDFEDFLNKTVEPTTPIVVFYKNDLCAEDIIQHTETLQGLKQMGMSYIPQAEFPYEILSNLPTHNVTTEDTVDYVTNSQIVMNEVENLDSVVKTYQNVKESNANVVGVLTGKGCRFAVNERGKREAEESNSTNVIFAEKNILMFSREGFSVKNEGSEEFQTLGKHSTVVVSGNGTKATPFNVLINFINEKTPSGKTTVTLIIYSETAGYWSLKQITLDNVPLNVTVSDVVFPFGFSYHCSENIVFMDDYYKPKNSIKLSDVQLQVFFGENPRKFSDPYDCVGFVTIPILTGLFVTFIIALIVMWGLIMILDIKTMDRFDDAKGKSITIFANE